MKKERIKRNVCYWTGFLILCLILYSCLRDDSDWGSDTTEVVKGENRELTVDVARSWYEASQTPVVATRSVVTDAELMTKLHWQKAFECRQEKFEVVEIPLLTKGGAILMDKETMEKSSSEVVRRKIRNISRMVIIKNLKTGETINFIMYIVGTLDYLMEAKHFEDNSYLYRDPHLSGSVYFYKPEGGLVNGWKYENGRIVAAISQGTEKGIQMQSTVNTRRFQLKCSFESTYVAENKCNPFVYDDAEYGLGFGVECTRIGGWEATEVCRDVDSSDGQGAAWSPPSPPSGGGGGSGGYQPPIAPKAKIVFRNSNMTVENWKALEGMLDKIIDNCMGAGVYNGLTKLLNGQTFSIQFNTTSGSSFGKQKDGSIGISLSTKMESGQLLHEMFHALRSYKEGSVLTYNGSMLNGEIESHYAQYLYQSSLPEYQKKGNEWAERDRNNSRWREIANLTKYVSKKGELTIGTSEDLLKKQIAEKVVPALRVGGYLENEYPLDSSRLGLENFQCLKEVTINC